MAGKEARKVKNSLGYEFVIESGFEIGEKFPLASRYRMGKRFVTVWYEDFERTCDVMLRRDNFQRNCMYRVVEI
jgi:hypothetical protein